MQSRAKPYQQLLNCIPQGLAPGSFVDSSRIDCRGHGQVCIAHLACSAKLFVIASPPAARNACMRLASRAAISASRFLSAASALSCASRFSLPSPAQLPIKPLHKIAGSQLSQQATLHLLLCWA